jgi:hypothetical protein
MSTTDEREAYQGDEQDFAHKRSLRTDAATTHNVEEVKCVDDIEHEIKAVDVVLRLLRADSSAEMTLDGKLTIQKHIRHVERIRVRLQHKLFAAMDEAGL